MATIAELQASIKEARTTWHENADKLTEPERRKIHERIKSLSNDLNAQLTAGAEPCEDCGGLPMGLVQEVAVKNKPVAYFEIGCPVCKDHRAQGFTLEAAVADWNSSNYLPPQDRE